MYTGPVPRAFAAKEFVAYWAPRHLCLTLPLTFDTYWASVDNDIRSKWRRSMAAGYSATWTTTPSRQAIADVFHSWDGELKQGRRLNNLAIHFDPLLGERRIDSEWPWAYYEHTQGLVDFMTVQHIKTKTTVAYLEVVSFKGHTMVLHALAHKDHMKCGVMKLMFVEAVREFIARGDKAVYYMKREYAQAHPQSVIMAHDLCFE